MKNQKTRMKLIQITKQLLTDGTPIEDITSRRISSEAETNLAMINYCFGSKDELMKISVNEIITQEFSQQLKIDTEGLSPKETLRYLLNNVCKAMVKYQEITRASIPYIMLQDDITLPFDVLPFIKQHYGDLMNETECKVLAFQMVYSLQLIFYRSEDFYNYCGIDIQKEQSLQKLIDSVVERYLN